MADRAGDVTWDDEAWGALTFSSSTVDRPAWNVGHRKLAAAGTCGRSRVTNCLNQVGEATGARTFQIQVWSDRAFIRPISARYPAGLILRASERILVNRLESRSRERRGGPSGKERRNISMAC